MRFLLIFIFLALFSQAYAANTLVFDQRDLRVLNTHRDQQGNKHIRMQQFYLGFPVLGGNVVMHYGKNRIWASGIFHHDLAMSLGNIAPFNDENKKQALFKAKSRYARFKIKRHEVQAVVYVDESQIAHWTYQIHLWIESLHSLPMQPVILLDVVSGETLLNWDEIKTIYQKKKGEGFGGNKKMGMIHYGVDKPGLPIRRDDGEGRCFLDNIYVTVLDMKGEYGPISDPVSFECQTEADSYWTGWKGDGLDEVNGAFSPSNDALYVGNIVRDVYVKWFGIEPLAKDLTLHPLIMRVHFGKKVENAFWDGQQMTFGDGDRRFYPLVSLGVAAHEISHGFTQHHSNLAYVGQSGGINESFSDMAAQVAEFYAYGQASWLMGHEIIKDNTKSALRYMEKPSNDGHSIDRADSYRRGMDVHYSSGVYNRFFYLLSHQPQYNPRTAFEVVLKANIDYWVSHSSFEDAACGVVWAAQDLQYPIEPIIYAFKEVAIDASQC